MTISPVVNDGPVAADMSTTTKPLTAGLKEQLGIMGRGDSSFLVYSVGSRVEMERFREPRWFIDLRRYKIETGGGLRR